MIKSSDTNISYDLIRQVLNIAFAVAQVLTTYLAFYTGTSFDEATRTDRGEHLIVPAGYTFIIWSLIYAGSIAYAVYQALPSRRENILLRSVGYFTAGAFLSTTLWLVMARFGSVWLTVVCMIGLLISLSGAFIRLNRHEALLSTSERYFVLAPVSIFTGWVTIAVFANTASALKESGWSDVGLSEESWTILMLAAAGLVGSSVTLWSRGNVCYSLTLIWAVVGIAVANFSRDQSRTVAAVALGVGMLIAVVLLLNRTLLRSQIGGFNGLPGGP